MRVAVIGSNGQLGQDLLRTAPAKVEVIPFTRKDFDITDRAKVFENLAGGRTIDVVINTAAFHKTDACEEEPDKAFLVNSAGVKNIVDACALSGAVLIHISTDYVFDGRKLESREPYFEDDEPNPINIYGISKYAGEVIIRNYLEKYYIVRSSSLYGVAGASGKGGNFAYTIIKKARAGEPIKVVDDIFMVPTHTKDLAEAIWKLIINDFPYGIYHITHNGYCSWYEFAKKILKYSGIKANIEPVKHTEFPTRAKRPLWSVLATKKGNIEMCHWEEGLSKFLRIVL